MVTGTDIKSARKSLGESQAKFALRFGVNQKRISAWEAAGPPRRGPGRVLIERVLADIALAMMIRSPQGSTSPHSSASGAQSTPAPIPEPIP
jgi:transcriptional regulator with XRE-family HTH domain